MLNSDQIQAILPHRQPFLFVDKVLEMTPGESIVAQKNVSVSEPHFAGHFPQKHVMPGVLILEALAQAGAILLLSDPEHEGKLAYFAGIDACRFKRPVVPGDVLRLEVTLLKLKGPIGKAEAKAYVDDDLACSAVIMFAIDNQKT